MAINVQRVRAMVPHTITHHELLTLMAANEASLGASMATFERLLSASKILFADNARRLALHRAADQSIAQPLGRRKHD